MKIGDKLPHFEVKNDNDEKINSAEYVGKPLIVYFYPKDNTAGCSRQACAFRDEFDIFDSLNIRVVGVSSDSVESHQSFKERLMLPFTLLADVKGEVSKALDVKRDLFGAIPGRESFVFDEGGILRFKYRSQLRFSSHAQKVVEAVKSL